MEAAPSQPGIWPLLTPKWRGALARLRQERRGSWGRLLVFTVVGGAFWAAIFGVAFRVLSYIQRVEDIGDLLATKVLGTILLALLSILLLSNVITALSTYFLAKDLDLLVAAPVSGVRLYLAKLAETVVHSSWMVALLALPIFTAYGIVYSGGPLFPLVASLALSLSKLVFRKGGVDLTFIKLSGESNGDAGDPVLARSDSTGRIFFATLQFSGAGINVFR